MYYIYFRFLASELSSSDQIRFERLITDQTEAYTNGVYVMQR